ncbi:MAG: response regulator [Anaerolineales bacterium]|nr:response regulator [Anaerolineales bacterium]
MSKPVVLLVDDETAYAKVIKEAITPMGLEVITASNAMEAMYVLQQGNPNLILLDVMMPEVDGLSLLRWLRSHSGPGRIPILIVSAKATPDDQEAARRAGADGFLAKPFTMQDLKDLLKEYLPAISSETN